MIIQGDCLEVTKGMEADSIDLICTDPPYGYSFMGKDWDKAVPSVEIWQECLRVLKPGAFCFVMSAPRSDVQMHMIQNLSVAGFRLDFTPIYWTYASGFPKAGNIGKLVDKRLGLEREVIGDNPNARPKSQASYSLDGNSKNFQVKVRPITKGTSSLEGSYAGFQPKPAVEVIIVAMKPLSEKTFVDQALTNGKGITWLDDARIPTDEGLNGGGYNTNGTSTKDLADASSYATKVMDKEFIQPSGRFPANLLVSDDVLNDGRVIKSTGPMRHDYREQSNNNPTRLTKNIQSGYHPNDSGSYSRYFDLDKWASTLPFLIVPKASKSEKNKGLDGIVSIIVKLEVCENSIIKEVDLARLLVTMDKSALKATAESGIGTKSGIEWSMSLFGNQYTEKYLQNTKSTTSTTTSSITTSQILSYLTGLLTNESTLGVNLEQTDGGNPAKGVELCNLSLTITDEKMALALGANPAQSGNQLLINVKGGNNIHSTVKPLKLMSYLITLGSREGDTVLDPFCGSGTSCLAAKKLKRNPIGIEREKEYVEIARARLESDKQVTSL